MASAEKVKVTDCGRKALMTLAQGDMRKVSRDRRGTGFTFAYALKVQ